MKNRNYFSLFFSLTLLSAFVICSGIVLFFQIDSYHEQQQENEASEAQRLAESYLITMFHQRNTITNMSIQIVSEVPCFVIKDEQNETLTYIYAYDGYLRELYLDEKTSVDLASGDKITPLGGLHMEENDGLYTFQLIYENQAKDLYLYQY